MVSCVFLSVQKFCLDLKLNVDREFLEQTSAPHREFYNVQKVDTHAHYLSCMNQKYLLCFTKSKLQKEWAEVGEKYVFVWFSYEKKCSLIDFVHWFLMP
jgi:hypothetical protein